MKSSYNQVDPTSEAYRVAKQVERVNEAFSSFGIAPEAIESKIDWYSNKAMAHAGKRIALSILTLEAMVVGKLKKIGYYDSTDIVEEKRNAFEPVEVNTGDFKEFGSYKMPRRIRVRAYMSEIPELQMNGLEALVNYYSILYDSIISMPEFASALKVSSSNNEDELVDEVEGE